MHPILDHALAVAAGELPPEAFTALLARLERLAVDREQLRTRAEELLNFHSLTIGVASPDRDSSA